MKKLFLKFLFFILAFSTYAQPNNTNLVDKINKASFIIHPKRFAESFFFEFSKDTLKICSTLKPDEKLVFSYAWKDSVTIQSYYLYSTSPISNSQTKRLQKDIYYYQVLNFNDKYIEVQAWENNKPRKPKKDDVDTLWSLDNDDQLVQKNLLFEKVVNRSDVTIKSFTDTSKYALLYIYRSKKITNSLANYIVSINKIPALLMKNNSGYILKVYKEGAISISSKLWKDESVLPLNISFGKKYLIKTTIHWKLLSKYGYNFYLETQEVTKEIGEEEFENTVYKN